MREKVSKFGQLAKEAEEKKNYKIAYNCYVETLDIFTNMITSKTFTQEHY
jgi:hypothetical protein